MGQFRPYLSLPKRTREDLPLRAIHTCHVNEPTSLHAAIGEERKPDGRIVVTYVPDHNVRGTGPLNMISMEARGLYVDIDAREVRLPADVRKAKRG